MNIHTWFPLGWTGLISLQSKGLSSLLQHHSSKASIFRCSAFCMVQLLHPYMTTGKTIALTITFVSKAMSLLLHMLPWFVITFLPRSKHLPFSWLQSPSAVIFGAQEEKICHCFHFDPFYLLWSDGTGCCDLVFLMLSFKPDSSLSAYTFFKKLFSSSSLSAIRVVSSAYLRLLITINSVLLRFYFHGYFPSSCYLKSYQVVLLVMQLPMQETKVNPVWGRSPGGGNGNPLQYSCLGNPMDRGAWWATVHGVSKNWTQLKQLSMHVLLKSKFPLDKNAWPSFLRYWKIPNT